MYKYCILFLIIILQLSLSDRSTLQDKMINGKVVGVIDGDTFKLLTKDSTLVKVRLANIDCPEQKQPFSAKAKEFVSNAIFNTEVIVKVLKKDRYGRYIANVLYGDSLSLSHELVKKGLAWHYIKYSKDKYLQELEKEAKSNKVGLWQDKNAIPPWEWRENKKNKE